jgi:hypothetical protein
MSIGDLHSQFPPHQGTPFLPAYEVLKIGI